MSLHFCLSAEFPLVKDRRFHLGCGYQGSEEDAVKFTHHLAVEVGRNQPRIQFTNQPRGERLHLSFSTEQLLSCIGYKSTGPLVIRSNTWEFLSQAAVLISKHELGPSTGGMRLFLYSETVLIYEEEA